MTWYTDMCSIMTMSLVLYGLDYMITNIYVYVMFGLRSNNCFVTTTPCTDGITSTALLVAWATRG